MNQFIFSGNLGRDAEQRFTPSGDSVVSFSVPAKSGYGEKAKTTWIRCTMFGKRGDSVLPYLKKGQQVIVSGEFSLNEYQDKEGQKKASPECNVRELDLIGKKEQSDVSEPAQKHMKEKQNGYAPKTTGELADDVPF